MGQEQNKYHVTDDGKIFSVMNDGSVSEIGNVSSLLGNNKNVEKKSNPNIVNGCGLQCFHGLY